MKTIATILFLLSFTFLYGQTVDISILKSKNKYKGEKPSWQTCNEDSAFYKADTLTFTTKFFSCCDYFAITIKKKNIFNIHTGQSCSEPPSILLTKKIKTGKIKKSGLDYYIFIYETGRLIRKFKITELSLKHNTDNEGYPRNYYSMTLIKA